MAEEHQKWIEICLQMAEDNVKAGQLPFAAIVVKEGEAAAFGVNDGKAAHDPTAHGEIRAIQKAGAKLQTTDLSGCVLYTNCEPCPMCLGAVYWSGIKEVHYGLSIEQQAEFDTYPKEMYEEFQLPPEKRKVHRNDWSGSVNGKVPFQKIKQD